MPPSRSASDEPPWISQSSGARSTTSRRSAGLEAADQSRASASSIDSSRPERTARSSVSRSHSTSRPSSGSTERTSSSRVVFSSQAAPSSPSRTMRWIVASKPSPGNGSRGSARVGDRRLAVVERAVGELDGDQDGRRQPERGEREQALPAAAHAAALLPKTKPAIPARTAKSAERANDERKARVSTACTDSSSESRAAATSGSSRRRRSRRTGRERSGISPVRHPLELAVEVERDRDLRRQRRAARRG